MALSYGEAVIHLPSTYRSFPQWEIIAFVTDVAHHHRNVTCLLYTSLMIFDLIGVSLFPALRNGMPIRSNIIRSKFLARWRTIYRMIFDLIGIPFLSLIHICASHRW